MTVKSPLTGTGNVRLTRKISCDYLINVWQKDFGIDVAEEFKGEEFVTEYQCNDTGLYFFNPPALTGSAHLYEELQKFDWYYNPDKWEHQQIIRQIHPGMRVLEVGCGEGSFLKKCNEVGAIATGLELNSAAVEIGCTNGLNILNEDLKDFSGNHQNQFDVVCCFQVLEHVPNPKEFISHCVNATKPGGQIIFGVPNAMSFFGKEFSILDLPPHHMLRWGKQAFESLTSIFSISIRKIQYEPLAAYHIDWFLDLLRKKGGTIGRLFRKRSIRKLGKNFLQAGGRNLFQGHTILVAFNKR